MEAYLLINDSIIQWLWPLMRVSGVMLVAPIIGSAYVPVRIRAVLAILLTVVALPHVGETPDADLLSPMFFLVLLKEVVIGFAIGFVLRLVIDAAVIAGQVLAISMGLHFATVVDPQQGGTPTLSQFYVIVASLLIVTTNAHITLIEMIATSFETLPIVGGTFSPESAWLVAGLAGNMFVAGLQIALPAVAAILIVNVAFGVVSRAAPTLNLFAVGFPITMLVGFIVTLIGFRSLLPIWLETANEAFGAILQIVNGG
jgi:flagellar biosynthetic protein FliR